MRVLLLHPADDFNAPWFAKPWDAVVDMGRAPKSFYDERSAQFGCPVFSVFDFAHEIEDLQAWRPLLKLGLGQVVDRFGIDWWDVISLLLQSDLQEIRLSCRLADKLRGCRTLVASHSSTMADALRRQLGIPLQILHGPPRRLMTRLLRSSTAAANLSFEEFRQVLYDKYDPHYRWRSKIAGSLAPLKWKSESVVLLPSAYSNVTHAALRYAQILPRQKFLLILARESGAVAQLPANVQTANLSAFATQKYERRELAELESRWKQMERSLQEHPVFKLAEQVGVLKEGPRWLRWGLAVRDAWVRVFETRPVTGCISADDSNPYTRIPLLLAEQRGVPAVACHHGALDGRMAFKNPRFSTYLAKGEMERDYLERICGIDTCRINMGAFPAPARGGASVWTDRAPWITFFSEPYGTDFWRAEAVFREIMPRLVALARAAGKSVVLKLHPFESARERRNLLNRILSKADRESVSVTDVPLSREILENTWCAVTVESTVAFECASVGIPTFLCGWLRHAYAGYAPQYVRFGVGRLLESPDELLRIPDMLSAAVLDPDIARRLVRAITPDLLSAVLRSPKVSVLHGSARS